jgi:head-tail adaptor
MISARDMAGIRTTVTASLTSTATVQQVANTINDAGGVTPGWTNRGTHACRISALSGGELAQYADKIGTAQGFRIRLPHNATVAVTDRITVSGINYDVIGVTGDLTIDAATVAICKRVV